MRKKSSKISSLFSKTTVASIIYLINIRVFSSLFSRKKRQFKYLLDREYREIS